MKDLLIFVLGILMIIYGEPDIKFAAILLMSARGCRHAPKKHFPV